MMINTISSAFETISTVEQGVELLDIFMHLQVREVSNPTALRELFASDFIKSYINYKLTQVYSRHSCEETLMERIFLKRAKDLFRWDTGAIMTGCSS